MMEITIRFYTEQAKIDSRFIEKINHLAQKYGMKMEQNLPCENDINSQLEAFIRKANRLVEGMEPQTVDSADLIREERESL